MNLSILPNIYLNPLNPLNPYSLNDLTTASLNEIHFTTFCILTKPIENTKCSHIMFFIDQQCSCHSICIQEGKNNILNNLVNLNKNKSLNIYENEIKKNGAAIKDNVPNNEVDSFKEQINQLFEPIHNQDFNKFMYTSYFSSLNNLANSLMNDYENNKLKYIGQLPNISEISTLTNYAEEPFTNDATMSDETEKDITLPSLTSTNFFSFLEEEITNFTT